MKDYVGVGDYRHTAAIDLDGCLIEGAWPELGEWMPGAVDAMFALHEAGVHLVVWTARTNPIDPWGTARNRGEVLGEIQRVRQLLDEAGLTFIPIHDHSLGKPSASIYVDDRAVRYQRRSSSWRKVVPEILARLDAEGAPPFPTTAGGH